MSKFVRSLVIVAAVAGLSACNNPSSTPAGDAGSCPTVGGTWTAAPGMTGMMVCGMINTVTVTQNGCDVFLAFSNSSTTDSWGSSDTAAVAVSGAWSAPYSASGIGSEPGTIGRVVANFTNGTLEYRTGSPEAVVCTWTLSH